MRKKDATKEPRILDAAADIILKEGAAAVSTVKVAKKVGISQSNVYLYFKDKNDLLMSVYQRELDRVSEMGDLSRLLDTSIPVAERVQLYLKSLYQYALANPDSLTLIQQIKFLMGQFDSNLFADDPNYQNNIVVKLLQEAIDAGLIRDVPVSLLMSLVFSVMHAHTLNIQGGKYRQEDYQFEAVYGLIWNGISKA